MSAQALPHVLVVDDDPALRELLGEYLAANGFRVQAVADGAAMRTALAGEMPDLLVLDLMLPGEDGLALARDLRARSDMPILMLSARGEEIDRVVGLEVGAADSMAKPFSPRELLARLRALLRRARPAAVSGVAAVTREAAAPPDMPAFGPFALDVPAHRLLRDGVDVRLTAAEFALLRLLVERPNRVLSRDSIIDLLKGYTRDPFDRSVDIRITRLRRKIEDDPAEPAYIRTVRGEGYLFNPRGASV